MLLSATLLEGVVQVVHGCGAALAVIAGAALTYLLGSRGLGIVEQRRHLPAKLVRTLRRILRWFVTIAAVVLLLQALGILQSVFAAVTGVFALLAIGFVAVWSVLSNTLCSLILMIVRPFRVGDTLRFPPDEIEGRVVNFNMLFTTLEVEDGVVLQVPNNTFFQRAILRRKGTHRIGLGDQLYRQENAALGDGFEPAAPQASRTQVAA